MTNAGEEGRSLRIGRHPIGESTYPDCRLSSVFLLPPIAFSPITSWSWSLIHVQQRRAGDNVRRELGRKQICSRRSKFILRTRSWDLVSQGASTGTPPAIPRTRSDRPAQRPHPSPSRASSFPIAHASALLWNSFKKSGGQIRIQERCDILYQGRLPIHAPTRKHMHPALSLC